MQREPHIHTALVITGSIGAIHLLAHIGGPADGLQFFGHVAIDGATEVMTVTLKDAADTALWSREIEPHAA